MQQPKAPTTEVALDIGSWISGPSYEVPRPRCPRCDDWTTVLYGDASNVISPCPVCRPDGYTTWLKDGNVIPGRETAA